MTESGDLLKYLCEQPNMQAQYTEPLDTYLQLMRSSRFDSIDAHRLSPVRHGQGPLAIVQHNGVSEQCSCNRNMAVTLQVLPTCAQQLNLRKYCFLSKLPTKYTTYI